MLPDPIAITDNFGCAFNQQHPVTIDAYNEVAGALGLGVWPVRCPDEDDMSLRSSIDAESLFDYSPSQTEATTTGGAVQPELTSTNIEHMLGVLKAERGKCLGELRGLDAALQTIDQLANRKRPGLKFCVYRTCANNVSLL